MNLIKTTERKLEYNVTMLGDLADCLVNPKMTKDCKEYIREQIEKTKINIIYYKEILNVLKGE